MLLCVSVAHVVPWSFATRRLLTRIGMAASMLLCVSVAHVVPWSFATRRLQTRCGVCVTVAQCCCCACSSMMFHGLLQLAACKSHWNGSAKVASICFWWLFLVFGAFHVPFKFAFKKLQNRTFWIFLWIWRRDSILEQVLGQIRAEMIWEWAEKSWDEVRRAEISWEDVRRDGKGLEDVRRGEKRWEDMRWADMSCEELRKLWEEPRWDETGWDGMSWDDRTWEERWRAEKSWEKERRHEMRWDEMRWGEMRWHRLRRQWDGMRNFQEKLRCNETRWNEKRSNLQKRWHRNATSSLPATYRHSLCSAL